MAVRGVGGGGGRWAGRGGADTSSDADEVGVGQKVVDHFGAQLRLGEVSTYAEWLLSETVDESLSEEERSRLFEELDNNAPMREDVLTLLAQFKANLGPFFLRALLARLDARLGAGDPVVDALRASLALPAAELCEELRKGDLEEAA